MKKILQTFSFFVISLTILSIFGWMVFHISKGDKKFGFLTEPVKFLYSFPDLFSRSVEEVKKLPDTFIPTPADFKAINKLKEDFLVLSTFSDTGDTRSIVLKNLKNDSVLYEWSVDNPYKNHVRLLNPLLLPEKSLIYFHDGESGLRRIDSLTNLVWKQDSIHAHHSMNFDSKGNIWVCTFEHLNYRPGLYKLNGRKVFFKDNFITKIDAETGRILFHKSITKILTENNLSNYVLKSDNVKDPIHINDIEPALKTTPFYKEGDLFISARQPSFIMHYRPSEDRVIKMIEGPFVSQHDVDFLNDHSLVLFNNNYYTLSWNESRAAQQDTSKITVAGDYYSNIVCYDFRDESFSIIGDSVFRKNSIFTATEGLVDFVDPTTYFIEEQNSSVLWIIKNDTVVYKDVFKSQHEGYHHLANWNRIIKDYE